MRTRKKIKRNLEVVVARGIVRLARVVPRRVGLRLFSTLGCGAAHIFRRDRERAVQNLAVAFPEMARPIRIAMMKAMFKTLGQNAYEFLTLAGSPRERIVSLVERIEGQENLDAAFAPGNGVIAVTGHIGCWELLAAYFAQRRYEVNVVGRELWESRLNRDLLRIRESLGYHTIDRDTGGREMMRILRSGGIVAVLMDQHTRVSGLYVPFFNRPAHTPTGVAKLAMATKATILPMAIYMTRPGRHVIRILPHIEVPEDAADRDLVVEWITRECSKAIEDLIRYDPKQWVWFHRRWREPEIVEDGYAAVG